jgi:hypothetical protein
MRLDNFVFMPTGNSGLQPSLTNLLIELRGTSLLNGGFPVRTSQQVIAKLYTSAFPLYFGSTAEISSSSVCSEHD